MRSRAVSTTPTRYCRQRLPRASPLRRNHSPVPVQCCQLWGEMRHALPTQPYRWLSGAGQPSPSRRRTDRSDGPHLNSKSNAPAQRGNELLSQPEVGFGRRIFTQSRRVSQNALLATEIRQSASAVSKSSIRSSLDSRPTDSRTSPSSIPARARCAADIPECEVVDGRVIKLSTPPRLGALIGIVTRSIKDRAAFTPPSSSKLSTPPKPSNSSHARR